jgi:hypothetical protein
MKKPPLPITQHKRFVPYGTHPNFCFAKIAFMLEPLGERIAKVWEVKNEIV